MEFVHPDDRAATAGARERIEGRGEEVMRFENRYRRVDGTYRWLQWAAVPRPAEGVVYARARDVTEEREAQERIAGLNRTLEAKNADLEAANRELEAFSYSVSHDLRSPLRTIDGFSLALLEDAGPRLDEASKEHLGRVRAAAQRMARLIDDLLGLARVARAEMSREPVDLSALAGAVADDLRASEAGRSVEFAIEPGLAAEGDARLLRVVLENLLGNAWKYTSKKASARIEFGREAEGERAYFVRDDGAGFEPAYAAKLFGAFQRLHRADEFPGTGIGLAIVQRIVRRHGGHVGAEGRVGRGATFRFTLGTGGAA
jgi:signal transduction histidine kinase